MDTLTNPVYNFFFGSDFDEKFMIKNGYACFSVLAFYVLFSKFLGPLLMTNVKPFQLRKTLIVYNFILAVANLHIAVWITNCTIRYWDKRCRIRDRPEFNTFYQESGMYLWQLYIIKFAELLDTVFIILRKKYNQISFLHVFHHSVVCALFWWIVKTRQFGFYLMVLTSINCTIHVIMYTYYGLSAIGPHMQKYLWWKKYLTTLQITQFAVIQVFMMIEFGRGCEYIDILEISLFSIITSFLILFCNFYRKTFTNKGIP